MCVRRKPSERVKPLAAESFRVEGIQVLQGRESKDIETVERSKEVSSSRFRRVKKNGS